jgi:two-component system sensor histidine kinase HydH
MLHTDGTPLSGRAKVVAVLAGVAAIGATHFLLGMDSPAAQVAHVLLGALYLGPIVAAASWLGWRAGVLCAVATAVVHWVHVVADWPAYLLLDVTQAVQMSVFVIVAAVVGVHAERRREERSKTLEFGMRADRGTRSGP